MSYDVLIVEDDESLSEALCDTVCIAGYRYHAAANASQAMDILEKESIGLVVSDIQLGEVDGVSLLKTVKKTYPEIPVVLMTAYGTIQQAVEAIQIGASDYLVKPFEPEVLVNVLSQYEQSGSQQSHGFISADPASGEILKLADKVAQKDVTVMVTGESGSGKEVLVRYIHNQSPRKNKPFIAINCAAIPDNMLEAMLFGYQKGAFTGAYKSSPGKFEQAQGGSILLDEISEMSLGLQAKLLRVLQEKEVERLGDQKVIDLDVRVMATSNRNMRDEVKAGRFREDLFYRLNVFPIRMLPLRDRLLDIVPTAEFLLYRATQKTHGMTPRLHNEAQAKLQKHSWPGNIRELDNVMQRALVLQSNGIITAEDIQFEFTEMHSSPVSVISEPQFSQPEENVIEDESLGDDLKSMEQKIILDTLKETSGSRKTAAEKLGISPRTLRYKLARMREEGVQIPAH